MTQEISKEILEDIKWFEENVTRYKRGDIDDDSFKPLRLHMGIYGQRQKNDNHMFRVKIPYGGLSPAKLRKIADVSKRYSTGIVHITTRENIQMHFVKLDEVSKTMQDIAIEGLFTREACGNTIRNVVGCPFSGVCPDEIFDITPYAHLVAYHFLRNPICQHLPRKFKISLSGCPLPCKSCGTNCPYPWIQDIGIVADIRDGKRGFRLYVGGGLGNTPMFAQILEDFTPENELLRTAEAIIRVFNGHGERKDRNRARLKFLIKKIGFKRFKELVFMSRQLLPKHELKLPQLSEAANSAIVREPEPANEDYQKWLDNNVIRQKQSAFSSVIVVIPLGDITSDKLIALADIAGACSSGFIRSSPAQNLILRWVRNESLPSLYKKLSEISLAEPSANTILDITSCPAAASCNLAFTHSKNLAQELREFAQNGLFNDLDICVKISGCPNSCGQHHIADIGFYGVVRKVRGRQIPAYQIILQGGLSKGLPSFGIAVGKVPSRLAPEAFRRIVRFYSDNRSDGESFYNFVERVTREPFVKLIFDLVIITPEQDDRITKDIGVEQDFELAVQEGECAK